MKRMLLELSRLLVVLMMWDGPPLPKLVAGAIGGGLGAATFLVRAVIKRRNRHQRHA